MRPAKIVAIVIGAFLVLIGLAMFLPGLFLLGAYGVMKDDSGFVQTSTRAVSTDGYALVSPSVELNIGPNDWNWVPTGGKLAVRIVAAGTAGKDVFVGIGPADKVAEYLDGVGYDEISDYGWGSSDVGYLHIDGANPASPPGGQTFWVASSQGPGEQDLRWDIADGDWAVVIMNADGSAPVNATMSLGARFGILVTIGIVVTVLGFIFLAGGIVLIIFGARRPRGPQAVQPPAGYGPPPYGTGYPPAGWQGAPGQYAPPESQWQPSPPPEPEVKAEEQSKSDTPN